MTHAIGYVVVEFNQASHQPSIYYEDVQPTLDDAVEVLRDRQQATLDVGRRERHIIATVTPCCSSCGTEGDLYDYQDACQDCVNAAFAASSS
jgi:hypothetical protein